MPCQGILILYFFFQIQPSSLENINEELLLYISQFSLPGSIVQQNYHISFVTKRLERNTLGKMSYQTEYDQTMMVIAEYIYFHLILTRFFNINTWYDGITNIHRIFLKIKTLGSLLQDIYFEYFQRALKVIQDPSQFQSITSQTIFDFSSNNWEKFIQQQDCQEKDTQDQYFGGLYTYQDLYKNISLDEDFITKFKSNQEKFKIIIDKLQIKIICKSLYFINCQIKFLEIQKQKSKMRS